MSILLQAGATSPWGGLASSDERVFPSWYAWNEHLRYRLHEEGVRWSFSRGVGQGISPNLSADAGTSSRWGVNQIEGAGSQAQKKFKGNTLDKNGARLGNCTVRGFRTSDNLFTCIVVSDPGGYYELCVAYTDAHFIVAYKSGSPDRAGTTINTLIPV